MNAKSRVPKLWGDIKFQGTFKELTLSIIGTTISIILTFGTAAFFEHREQEQNRRLIAMMVISDIYEFECYLHWTDSLDFAGWQKDMEELRSLSRDSILRLTDEQRKKYWNAIGNPIIFAHDKTAEGIFSSNISTWKDIGNFRFIKEVGRAYSEIADIEKNVKAKIEEKGNNGKLFETHYDTENMSDGEQLIAFMEMKEVQRFMDDFCIGFRPYIKNEIDVLRYKVDQCLEIIGIDKEEMIDFILNDLEKNDSTKTSSGS